MTEPTDNSELTDRLFAELESTADEALTARLAADPELAAEMAALEATLGELREGLQPLPDTPRELRADQRQAVLDLAAQLDREAAAPASSGGTATTTSASAAPTVTLWSRIPVAMKLAASLAICAGLAWLVVQSGLPEGPGSGSTVAMQDETETAPDADAIGIAESEQALPAIEKAKMKMRTAPDDDADVLDDAVSADEGLEDASPARLDALADTKGAGEKKQAAELSSMQARTAKEATGVTESKRDKNVAGGGMGTVGGMSAEGLAQVAETEAQEETLDAELKDNSFAAMKPAEVRRERGPSAAPRATTAPSVAASTVATGDDAAGAPVLADARVRVLGVRQNEAVAGMPEIHGGREAMAGPAAAPPAAPPAVAAPEAEGIAAVAPPARQQMAPPAAAMADMAEADMAAADAAEPEMAEAMGAAVAMEAPDAAGAVTATTTASVPGRVTVALQDATPRQALTAIGDDARVLIRVEGDRIVLIPRAFRLPQAQASAPDEALLRRLDAVRIPTFQLQDATIDAALAQLIAASRAGDPDGVGIPAPLVLLPDPESGRAVAYLPYHQAPLAALASADSATVAVAGRDVVFALGAVPVDAPAAAASAAKAEIEAATRAAQAPADAPADADAGAAQD